MLGTQSRSAVPVFWSLAYVSAFDPMINLNCRTHCYCSWRRFREAELFGCDHTV